MNERAFQEEESNKEDMGTPGREMRIPLLEEQEEVVPDRITSVLVFSAFFAVCGSYVFGNAVSYSSPAESGIMDELGLSLAEYSVFGSLLTVGGLLGALCSGKIADIIGRRGAMWVTDVSGIIGWCAIFLSEGAWSLDLGRLLLGFGVGLASYVVPVYVAEVTPKNLRGGFVSLCMLVIACGMSMTYIIGTVLNWRTLACLGTIPCLLQLVGLFLVPESPRWLAKIGREKDMKSALQRLRGKNTDISKETSEIEVYIETLQQVSEYRIFYIFQRKYAQALTVGLGLMVFQQLGGLNAYGFYMSSILERAGASSTAGSITTAIVKLAANIAAVFLMDKFGRRLLLLVSASGACFAGFLFGLSFLLQDYHQSTDVVSTLTFIGIVVFTGFFSIGLGGIPWIIMAEVSEKFDFPNKREGISRERSEFGQLGRLLACGLHIQLFLSMELSRCVFHVLRHLLLRNTLHSKNGAGNKGAHAGGNRGINDLIARLETVSSVKHICILS